MVGGKKKTGRTAAGVNSGSNAETESQGSPSSVAWYGVSFVVVVVALLAVGLGESHYLRNNAVVTSLQSRLFALNEPWLPPKPLYGVVKSFANILDQISQLIIPPPLLLLKHATAYMQSASLFAATELQIAEALGSNEEGGKTTNELAGELKLHEPSLFRLLRALETIGVFQQNESTRKWYNTPLSQLLRRDHPQSLAHAVLMLGSEQFHAYGHLSRAIQTGQSAYQSVYGADLWEYNREHPVSQAVFDGSMSDLSKIVNLAIATDFDFSRYETVVDVGGGHGALIKTILKHHPRLRGVLFDQEVVIQEAKRLWNQENDIDLKARCELSSGSFFDTIPPNADVYILKQIAHDWGDEEVIKILRRIRDAMKEGGTLVIADRLVTRTSFIHSEGTPFVDLLMLSTFGGDARERNEDEFKYLLQQSGFQFVSIIPTRSSFFLIQASKPPPSSH